MSKEKKDNLPRRRKLRFMQPATAALDVVEEVRSVDFGLGPAQTALSAQSDALSAWGDELANSQTPGFQGDLPTFTQALGQNLPAAPWAQALAGTPLAAVSIGAGVVAGSQQDLLSTGVAATGRSLDVAVNGPGYLVVASGGQRLFTRNGSLSVDASGELVDSAGAAVLSTAGTPVRVAPGSAVEIENGRVVVAGRAVATLAVAQVPNPGGLTRVGGSHLALSALSGAARIGAPAAGQLLTGYLDLSATSVSQAMAGLVTAETGFELAAKVAQQAAQLASLTAQIPG